MQNSIDKGLTASFGDYAFLFEEDKSYVQLQVVRNNDYIYSVQPYIEISVFKVVFLVVIL